MKAIELTPEQSAALNEQGIVQGREFVLMSRDAFREFLGVDSLDDLRRELQPAFDEADNGQLQPWNMKEILAELHREHRAPQCP